MAQRLADLPEQSESALQSALACTIAQSVLVEYAAHLNGGAEPYDALVSTATGTLELPPEKATLFSLLTSKSASKRD